VESLALFSPNETVEDVPTTDLRYLMVPHLRAELLSHADHGEPRQKPNYPNYFYTFLSRLAVRKLQWDDAG
jgi:hypothetical protein